MPREIKKDMEPPKEIEDLEIFRRVLKIGREVVEEVTGRYDSPDPGRTKYGQLPEEFREAEILRRHFQKGVTPSADAEKPEEKKPDSKDSKPH